MLQFIKGFFMASRQQLKTRVVKAEARYDALHREGVALALSGNLKDRQKLDNARRARDKAIAAEDAHWLELLEAWGW